MINKNPGESYLDYKKRVIDAVSPSFCAAKWYNATIWLGYGATVSCHHPPAHQIDLVEIQTNPSAIHNTKQKKEARREMLDGQRPSECDYCWKVEDMQLDNVSDRVFKTVRYDQKSIAAAVSNNPDADVNLQTLEISFDRTCNFACSYCSPTFSTTWVKDISNNGPYEGLLTDGRHHYKDTSPWAQPYKRTDVNPYVDAFWQWWPELSQELQELRITGGEPLMSDDVWKLLDKFKTEELKMSLAINSNLGAKKTLIDKLIVESHNIHHLVLYTSNEAKGKSAEYIRDGLVYDEWLTNMKRLTSEGKFHHVGIMMTINALCLPTITDFLDDLMAVKEELGNNAAVYSMNILRFPTFQSPLVLPKDLLALYSGKLRDWYDKHKTNPLLSDFEKDQTVRLIDYLNNVERPTNEIQDINELRKDFKSFYSQYDVRRGLNFREAFPQEMVDWYDSIETVEAKQMTIIPIFAQ